jgi:hypothetical protein
MALAGTLLRTTVRGPFCFVFLSVEPYFWAFGSFAMSGRGKPDWRFSHGYIIIPHPLSTRGAGIRVCFFRIETSSKLAGMSAHNHFMRFYLWLLLLPFAILPGCESPFMGRPNWCDPGSASQQLTQAKKFDPYPDPTIAPPVLGGRPLGFMEPRPEPNPVKQQFAPGTIGLPYAPAY